MALLHVKNFSNLDLAAYHSVNQFK
uniref:Uncharacterized protein n=1 Tax=Rhizophora mucronata TaxID=61149 RepID=A0A2P2PQW7_RHIMU